MLAVDRNASVADCQENMSSVYVWVPIFAHDGFIDDDTLISFFDKLNEANLGVSALDKVR